MIPASLPAAWAPDEAAPHGAGRHGGSGREWVLQRRCALSPAQLGHCLAVLVAASLLVGGGFLLAGVPFVTAFAGLELLAVLVAFGIHARHAADGDRLCLEPGRLHVERRRGGRVDTLTLALTVLRVSAAADGAIELRSPGRVWRVGELVSPERRRQVLDELKVAVADARARPDR